MEDHEDVVDGSSTLGTSTNQQDTSLKWSPSDNAALLPHNVPLRRIERAWERKPHSPFARGRHVRKVWRRVQLPVSHTGDAHVITQQPSDSPCQSLGSHRGGTIQSPRKVVKKLCLRTEYGQDSRITDWEREKAIRYRESFSRRSTRSRDSG